MKRRASFYWWEEAVEVARMTAAITGVRQRVRKVGGSNPWQVTPATVRLVEVPC